MTDMTDFDRQVQRIWDAQNEIDPHGPGLVVDPATETVTLAGGAIRAVGLPMVTWLADRLTSISLKKTTRELGHGGL